MGATNNEELQSTIKILEEEIAVLRRRLQDAPRRVRVLEERLLEAKGRLTQAVSQNEKLSVALEETRDQLAVLRDEVEKLTAPPNAFGIVQGTNTDGTLDVITGGEVDQLHFPGYSQQAAEFLVREREIDAVGIDTASLDHGPSKDFIAHRILSEANKPGLENIANLNQLPPKGATLIALPMKIRGGSGGPVRVIALLP